MSGRRKQALPDSRLGRALGTRSRGLSPTPAPSLERRARTLPAVPDPKPETDLASLNQLVCLSPAPSRPRLPSPIAHHHVFPASSAGTCSCSGSCSGSRARARPGTSRRSPLRTSGQGGTAPGIPACPRAAPGRLFARPEDSAAGISASRWELIALRCLQGERSAEVGGGGGCGIRIAPSQPPRAGAPFPLVDRGGRGEDGLNGQVRGVRVRVVLARLARETPP